MVGIPPPPPLRVLIIPSAPPPPPASPVPPPSFSASPPPAGHRWGALLWHAVTLLVALAGAALALLLHIPLPWMIGPLIATAVLAWREKAVVAGPVRPAALVVLGLGLGQSFTPPVLQAVAAALPAIVAAGLLTILSGILIGRMFVRLAGTDGRTGYFCSVPGGIVGMVVLAQRAGVSVPTVTLAQTLRMVVVVLVFPPVLALVAPHAQDTAFSVPRPEVDAAGLALLGVLALGVAGAVRSVGFPNPWMIGPCLLCIVLAGAELLPSGVPVALVDAAQLGMGASLGARLTRRFLLSSRRLAIASVLSTLALSALLAALGVALGLVAGLPPAAVALGMAPGGMPEMTITAKALDLAVPLVLGFHLVRALMCNLLVGPIWRAAVALRLAR